MKKLIYVKYLMIISVILPMVAKAQQAPLFTHYMENTLLVNPAYAGSRNFLTATLLHRSQWVGFEGSPETQTLTLHGPVYHDKFGLGISIMNDKIGVLSNQSIYVDYSYKLKFEKSYLSLGISGGFNFYSVNIDNGYVADENDDLATDFQSKLLPDFGFGIYYYSQKLYFGVSVPQTLTFDELDGSFESSIITKKQYYYLIGGGVFALNKDFAFFPTFFIRHNFNTVPVSDITLSFVYKNFVRLGAMYRTTNSFGTLLSFFPKSNIMLGYSFEWSVNNQTGVYNAGTHEIYLRIDLIHLSKKRIYSPRLF